VGSAALASTVPVVSIAAVVSGGAASSFTVTVRVTVRASSSAGAGSTELCSPESQATRRPNAAQSSSNAATVLEPKTSLPSEDVVDERVGGQVPYQVLALPEQRGIGGERERKRVGTRQGWVYYNDYRYRRQRRGT
jgi:hypothetical protein